MCESNFRIFYFLLAELYAVIIVPLEDLHVDPYIYQQMNNSSRVFNRFIQFRNPDDISNHRFCTIIVGEEGKDVTFLFHKDNYGRIINVYTLPNNIRPSEDRSLKTHVATLYGLEFLVHKNRVGDIVGASPPTTQPRRSGSKSPPSSEGSTGSL